MATKCGATLEADKVEKTRVSERELVREQEPYLLTWRAGMVGDRENAMKQ
jgi:hypothetical protein